MGTVACGWALEAARSRLGWDEARTYRLAFYGYAGLGVVKAVLALMLSPAVEVAAMPAITVAGAIKVFS